MGKLTYFFAGGDLRNAPGGKVEAVLLNVNDHGLTETLIEKTKVMLERIYPKYTMLDSGGFNFLQESLKPDGSRKRSREITPSVVVEAAVEFNPTAMMALDFPISKEKNPVLQEREFKDKISRNIEWTVETAELREKHCPDVALFIPVQAYTIDQFFQFMLGITGVKFTGFAMPIRNMTLRQLALFLLTFRRLGVRFVHLLGVSAYLPMALIAYMARNCFEWTSVDSKTWRDAARYNEYLDPRNLSHICITNDKNDLESVSCTCPFCAAKPNYLNLPYMDRRLMLEAHNYQATRMAFQGLMDHAGSPIKLKEYLFNRTRDVKRVEEVYRTISLVESVKDADLGRIEQVLA